MSNMNPTAAELRERRYEHLDPEDKPKEKVASKSKSSSKSKSDKPKSKLSGKSSDTKGPISLLATGDTNNADDSGTSN